ncbi:adenosine deaminase [Gorillibacterium timonense]|uniref:adenosine deaminase n=1 Tax=Gorillibacterium timonense TaxID=1689269 RepID=UPI00071E4FC1|nr:adenosine deaminase [Gorillibacterium timonense]
MNRTIEPFFERGSWIRQMPKVELHMHLDGSLLPETVFELAAEQGISLPARSTKELLPYMQVDGSCTSLTEYLSKFAFTTLFLQTRESLERAACEAVEQAAGEGCRYVEVRFAPQLHRERGLSCEEAVHHVIAGLKRGEQQYGCRAQAIVICMRHHSTALNREAIEAAAVYSGRGVAAVDLAGDEAGYPASLFRDIFILAHRKGLPVTIHAGEAAGPDNIYTSVMKLGASRIGHGVRLKEDPAIRELIRRRRVPLEMCPVSNIQTKAVADWSGYPIRDYFDSGIPITVNTDNPGVSGTSLTREYGILAELFHFTRQELSQLVLNAADAAFLGEHDKSALKAELGQELDEWKKLA